MKQHLRISVCRLLESHPTWVRGLKHPSDSVRNTLLLSHPTWVRGLKPQQTPPFSLTAPVAPYVGAWIETSPRRRAHPTASVAPYVGAWIETDAVPVPEFDALSHPTWVRGLKRFLLLMLWRIIRVAPYVGAWIETICWHPACNKCWSHPTWVRGLKLRCRYGS